MTAQEIRQICARDGKSANRRPRGRLSEDRDEILQRTGGACHVCGEALSERWQADHVVPHARAGQVNVVKYLPICKECNRLRWFHSPKVIRLIMRLGIYAKSEIRNKTPLGEELVSLMLKHFRTNQKKRASKQTAG